MTATRRRLLATSLRVALLASITLPGIARAVSPRAGFTAAPVISGLEQPTAIAFAPDGRLFVLEKAGAVRVWSAATGLAPDPVITLPSCTASEMGLLGLAFDSAFATNGFLYLYHSQPPGGDVLRCPEGSAAGRRNRVVRVTVAGASAEPASLTEILGGLRTDNGNHDGGCLRIGPDGFLYVGVGDTGVGDFGRPGDATNPYARDLGALEGKILRLTLDGRPAPGNPFLGRGGAADFVFASGLRNPFRFAFDPRTGLLWAGDVGQHTFEEIDVVRAGDDLGWPMCEGFQPAPPCPGGTVRPVHVYPAGSDGASVTGGVFYDGSQFDVAYRGDYFFGDFVLDRVWRARLDATRTAFAAEPEVFLRDAAGPVDFAVGLDGALYYVAFSAGEVVRVTQNPQDPAPDACGRALASAAPRLVRAAGRRPLTCDPSCPAPRVPRAVGRRLARACGATPPAGVCAGLGCGACSTSADLGACLASAAAAVATEAMQSAGSEATERCTRAVRRSLVRTAATGLRDIAVCVRRGGESCTAAPAVSGGKLPPACSSPPPALCSALDCAPCTTTADLRACVGRAVVAPVDALARTLVGG
jgi:glucose/arabinose dehydrogenase